MHYPEDGPPLADDEKLVYIGDNPAPSIVKKTPEEMGQLNVTSHNQSGGMTANTINIESGKTTSTTREVPRWLKIVAVIASIVGVLVTACSAPQ